jgi:replication-associated recombination protein RarA
VLQQHEQNACYWISQLYFAGANIWKKLFTMMHEDIGVADKAVWDEIRKLEQDAERIKDKRHSDLLVVFNAVLCLCRAKKSRAADNIAIHLRTTDWRPVSQADIEAAAEAAKTKREVPDYAIDGHTAKGCAMGRGLDFFLEEGSKLGNPATDVREVFSPDYRKGYIAGYAAGCAATNESDAAFTPPTDKPRPRSSDTEKVAA